MNTLIVTGGKISKKFVKNNLKTNKYDIIIAVDKGLEILHLLKIAPNHIVGDFDSINKKILEKYKKLKFNIKELLPEKDFTDTECALELAIKLKSEKITIIGATGTRIDHTIANIQILKKALDKNIETKIIDENNEIQLLNACKQIMKDDNYKYISLIPLTDNVKGVTLEGLKYKLEDATLQIGNSLTVSNEQISEVATINVKEGIVILIKSKD